MNYTTPFASVVLMGKIASGKGTQANLILSHFGGVLYSNGNKLREVAQKPTVFGRKLKEIYEDGQLLPEWIASYWMTHALVSQHPDELIVFEAVAKKPDEAHLFHDIHTMLGRPYVVFHIDVTDDVVHERSRARARDIVDAAHSVEKRLEQFKIHTTQSIEIFRQHGVLVDIDGNQSAEAVQEVIFHHLRTAVVP
jgi:adenylate kinase